MHQKVQSKRIVHLAVILAILVTFFSFSKVSAQPTPALTEEWRNSDYGFASRMMDSDLNDNIYIVGDTVVGDYLIIKKFSPAGALLWQISYDPTNRLRGVWIAIDNNNNPVVLASIIAGSNADPAGWVILKYDTNGTLLWANSLPGSFRDARRVEVDVNNDIYVAGRMFMTNPSGNTTMDSVLIKFSPAGGTLWTAVFDHNSAVDEPYSLAVSSDSSRIGVAGKSGNMFMALMYDANGNLLWSNTNPNIYPANDLAFGPGNISYFATGTYFPQDPNPLQMAIVKFDAAGSQLWVNSYSMGDRIYRVRVDDQGNVVATGIDAAGYIDWMTIKTDANGSLLWSQRYDGGRNNDEIPNMLTLDTAGAVYITGTGGPNPSSGTISYLKGVVAKYNPDGTPQWAVWDDYAGGKAISLGAGDTLTSLGFGYLVTTRYTQTGLADTIPTAPTNLTGYASFTGSSYVVILNFVDNANNEFWVEVERCEGSGCTNFAKVGQTLGENATSHRDQSISRGVTYTYRVRALGFMGASGYTNTVEVSVPPANIPAAPSNLTAEMSAGNVVLNWQDHSTNESLFLVERCQGAGCSSFAVVDSTGVNVTTWTDYYAAAGESYSYRVRAWNMDGYSDYANTATIVTPGGPNTAPVLDFIGNHSVDELTTLVFTATATDSNLPAQTLIFSLGAGAPTAASINPVSGVFSWTPSEVQGPGVYPVTVIVTDDGIPPMSDAETFDITVYEVNQAPLVSAGPDQTIQEGQPVQFSGRFTDTIRLPQALAGTAVYWDFGDGLSATGSLTPTHSFGDNGVYTVTLVVTDTLGSVGRDSLKITATNATPNLPVLADQVVKINRLVVIPVQFTDPGWLDSHPVMIEWAPGITETLNLDAGVTDFTLQHTYSETGQFTVTVTVTDQDGAFDSRSFVIAVEAFRMFLPLIQH